MGQRKAPCSSRYLPSLSATHGSGRWPQDVGTGHTGVSLGASDLRGGLESLSSDARPSPSLLLEYL